MPPAWTVTTVTAGFAALVGILHDGSNIRVMDLPCGNASQLDGKWETTSKTVTVGAQPSLPTFDGANIWVPNTGSNLRLRGHARVHRLGSRDADRKRVERPVQASFDGERILVTTRSGNTVSLWKAADLTTLGFFVTGLNSDPFGAAATA